MIILQKHPQVYENITKMRQMITLQILNDLNTSADGNTKAVETIVPLKYLSNLCRTLECHQLVANVISFLHCHQLELLLILQVQQDLE